MDETLINETRTELGFVVEQFSRLEWAVRRSINLLLRAPGQDATDLVLSEMSFRSHLNVLNGLFRMRYPLHETSTLEELLRTARKAEEQRNSTMHSMWAYNIETGAPVRARVKTRKRGLKTEYERDPLPKLRELNGFLSKAVGRAVEFSGEIGRLREAELVRRGSER